MKESIIYGEPLRPRVTSVLALDDYSLMISFTNGEQRKFDAKPLLTQAAYKQLNSISFFKSVKVESGSILWPNDIDYCPDTLYQQSVLS